MASIQKLDRELSKKAKAQQKRARKLERRAAAKAQPPLNESVKQSGQEG